MSPSGQILLLLLGSGLLWGQQAVPTVPSPALVYERRPLLVPVACRAEDFEVAGIQCSEEEPCRIFLELAAVEAVGPKILLAGNLHTSSATLCSLLLASDDAGTLWREPLKRIPGAGFESLQFLDAQQGWISVQPQGQFAADPYLLATSDGGANWQKSPIWSEEGRAGLLQQFHFDRKDHGFALIDRSAAGLVTNRYELYETLTGGGSWMLRETSSRPITPKWPPRQPSEWRLREDQKLKTYELERRVGGTWRRMANFRTDLATCKALEPKQAPQTAPVEPPRGANP